MDHVSWDVRAMEMGSLDGCHVYHVQFLTKYIEIQFLEGSSCRGRLLGYWFGVIVEMKIKRLQAAGFIQLMLIHQCFSSYVDKALGPRGFSSSGTQLTQKPIMRPLPCMWDSIAIGHLESSLCQNVSTPLITDLINMQNMCGIGSEWLRCATTHPLLPPAAPFGGSSTAHFAALDAAPGERGGKTWESPRPQPTIMGK